MEKAVLAIVWRTYRHAKALILQGNFDTWLYVIGCAKKSNVMEPAVNEMKWIELKHWFKAIRI